MPFNTGGGDYFKPATGRYIAQLISFEDGPLQTYALKAGEAPKGPQQTMRWGFNLYNLDSTPVIDTKTGTLAIYQALSSATVGVGKGTEAKARVWFRTLLSSKGIPFVEPKTDAEIAAMIAQAMGTFVYIDVPATGGPGVTSLTAMIPQPGAPAIAAFVVPPLPAPVAQAASAAPLQVPTAPAAPFAPAPLPAAVPVMPFAPAAVAV